MGRMYSLAYLRYPLTVLGLLASSLPFSQSSKKRSKVSWVPSKVRPPSIFPRVCLIQSWHSFCLLPYLVRRRPFRLTWAHHRPSLLWYRLPSLLPRLLAMLISPFCDGVTTRRNEPL